MPTGTLVLSLARVVETGESVNYFSVWRQPSYWTISTNKSSASCKQASFLLLRKCVNFFKKLSDLFYYLETKISFVIWSTSWICKVLLDNWGIVFSSVHAFTLHFRKFGILVDTLLLTLRDKWPVVVKTWLCPGGHEVNLINLDHSKSSVPLGWKQNCSEL